MCVICAISAGFAATRPNENRFAVDGTVLERAGAIVLLAPPPPQAARFPASANTAQRAIADRVKDDRIVM